MSLWDAVTGKIWNWNKNKEIASKRICCNLSSWLDQAMRTVPNKEKVTMLRDYFFANWAATIYGASEAMDDLLSDYKSNLFQLTPSGIIQFSCNIQSHIICVEQARSSDEFEVFMYATQVIYNKSPDFQEVWKRAFLDDRNWILNSGKAASTLMQENNHVLAVKSFSPADIILWVEFAGNVSLARNIMMKEPNWSSIVDKEIRAGLN